MIFSKTVFFTNFSEEDFTSKFDGVSYTFLKGKTYADLPEVVALHFARHLAKRELGRIDRIYNDLQIDNLAQQALPNVTVASLKAKEISIEWEAGTEPKPEPTGQFTEVSTAFPDIPAKSTEPLGGTINKSDADLQKEPLPIETDVRDNKEMPKKKMGRPKKIIDDEYQK